MNEARLSGRDLAAALGVIVIWGLNFVAMKFALHDFTPFQLGAARYVLAVLPLVFFIRAPKLHWKWVVLYGLCQGVGQFGFLFSALKVGMTAALASVLMQTQVFFTALFSFVLLRERMSRPLVGGLLLASFGLLCFTMNFLTDDKGAMGVTTVWGFLLSLCAAAMWSASNIVARKAQQANPHYEPLQFLVWSSLVPVVPFVLFSLLFDPVAATPEMVWRSAAKWASVPWTSWLAVAYLGWIATIWAYAMWTGLLKRHPANRVAPFSLGVPVVGLTAGMLALGETITPWQWAGIALVVAALACVMFGDKILRKIGR
ncbi:MAG: EamA family transporter [Rhodoferax sp.]|nr:EamA family transporter [Rhodoferax sp.]